MLAETLLTAGKMEAGVTFILNFLAVFYTVFLTRTIFLLYLPLTVPPFTISTRSLKETLCTL